MASPKISESLLDRRIVLGVSGSIAAYKSALIVRLLRKAGAEVQVLMTKDATRFIPPLTLGTLSGREVLTDLFPEDATGQAAEEAWTKHVTLGLWADLFVVAPATAQTIAKLAYGFSDSMLTATALSAECPLLVCPAMDRDMYHHPATQSNLERLRALGYAVMPAEHGELASGLVGQGRLPEPESIVNQVTQLLNAVDAADDEPKDAFEGFDFDSDAQGDTAPDYPDLEAYEVPIMQDEGISEGNEPDDFEPSPSLGSRSSSSPDSSPIFPLKGPKSASDTESEDFPAARGPSADATSQRPLDGLAVLVTAGPTQEPIDPVRVITNRSTGTMGYALAQAAAERGASVMLVSGPTCLDTPPGVERIDVTTTKEMSAAVGQHADADLILMAAAVSDYTPARMAPSKIKKEGSDELAIRLRRTTDILETLGERKRPYQQLVGFALETDDGLTNARRKLSAKNLDWIVLNNPLEEGAGFGTTTNRVTLIHRDGYKEEFPILSKREVANRLLDRVLAARAGAVGPSEISS
jgi:phosphopantothenoylcysteine decarboxylase/phosphopantothenate--cysteine ligase